MNDLLLNMGGYWWVAALMAVVLVVVWVRRPMQRASSPEEPNIPQAEILAGYASRLQPAEGLADEEQPIRALQRGELDDQDFVLLKSDLLEVVTVSEVEHREAVFNRRGAAPPVPFGFLNPLWAAFKASLTPADVILFFDAKRGNPSRYVVTRLGYVALREGQIRQWFISRQWTDEAD